MRWYKLIDGSVNVIVAITKNENDRLIIWYNIGDKAWLWYKYNELWQCCVALQYE